MPLPPSHFSSTSSFFRSSSCGSDASFRSSTSSSLPPPGPCRRVTAVRRGIDMPSLTFHTRPLRSLSVVSRSPSPSLGEFHGRPMRSPSPSSRSSSLPRRIYPQVYVASAEDSYGKEESPVVFDANLSFVLGCRGKMRQKVRAVPAHQEDQTASNALTSKIANFLRKTDHVMDEWKRMGHRDEEYDGRRAGRSRSATNILIKGFQLYSRSSSCSRSSIARDFSLDDCTEAEADEVFLRTTGSVWKVKLTKT